MRSPKSPDDARGLIRWAEQRAAEARATLEKLSTDRQGGNWDWRLRQSLSDAISKARTEATRFDGIAQRYRSILATMEPAPDKR